MAVTIAGRALRRVSASGKGLACSCAAKNKMNAHHAIVIAAHSTVGRIPGSRVQPGDLDFQPLDRRTTCYCSAAGADPMPRAASSMCVDCWTWYFSNSSYRSRTKSNSQRTTVNGHLTFEVNPCGGLLF